MCVIRLHIYNKIRIHGNNNILAINHAELLKSIFAIATYKKILTNKIYVTHVHRTIHTI